MKKVFTVFTVTILPGLVSWVLWSRNLLSAMQHGRIRIMNSSWPMYVECWRALVRVRIVCQLTVICSFDLVCAGVSAMQDRTCALWYGCIRVSRGCCDCCDCCPYSPSYLAAAVVTVRASCWLAHTMKASTTYILALGLLYSALHAHSARVPSDLVTKHAGAPPPPNFPDAYEVRKMQKYQARHLCD